MDILEQKRKRIETIVKVLAVCAIAFFVSPIIFATIQGLIGLVVAGSIGFIAINMAPWFAAKVANWRLKALKAEAAKNPIETLENQFNEKQNALLQFRESIKEFHAEVENVRAEIAEHKEKYPNDTRFDDKLNKMCALLANRAAKYKQAQKNLADFNEVIERKRSEWKIIQASMKMEKAAGVGEDFISKLMADTALDSIQTGLNTAFAELEVSLLDEPNGNEVKNVTPVQHALPSTSEPITLDLDLEETKNVKLKR